VNQLRAIQALRLNYRWRGVWAWLKGWQRPWTSKSVPAQRGYQRILTEPQQVIAEQEGLAEGVMG
jgi:hypothetical protein